PARRHRAIHATGCAATIPSRPRRASANTMPLLAALRRPPRPSTLFPYTTLFRSAALGAYDAVDHLAEQVGMAVVPGVFLDHMHRSEEHTSELQSRGHLVCRLLLEKKNTSGLLHRYTPARPQRRPGQLRIGRAHG